MIKKNTRGFSLIDLLVSVSIATLVMSVVLFSYRTFQNKLAVSASIQKINTVTRQAQRYALSAKEAAKNTGNFTTGYGVYFSTTDPGAFYLFADKNGDGIYNGDTTCAPNSECIERDLLNTHVNVATFCGTDASTGSVICPPTGATSASIVFPSATFENTNRDTKITFATNSGTVVPGTYQSVQIVADISDPITATTVQADETINTAGQVSSSDLSSIPTTNHPPVITLSGSSPMNVNTGSTFTDPGATATDQEDGNVTGSITVTGTVNTLVPGTYTLTYNVKDSGGLSASPVTRSVVVATNCNPTLAGTVATIGAGPVAAQGNYVYGAFSAFGNPPKLQIFNVAVPSSPTVASSVSFGLDTSASAVSIVVQGNYAYLLVANSNATNKTEIEIFDVSAPSSPSKVGSVTIGTYAMNVSKMAVQGNYAYVVVNNVLDVFNVSNPSSPVLAGSLAVPINARRIVASGSYAYVMFNDALRIYNVSNPASPSLVGSVVNSSNTLDMAMNGGYLYAIQGGQVTIFNVSIPASPTVAGSFTPSNAWIDAIRIQGSYAYLAAYDNGSGASDLEALDLTNPVSLKAVGSVSTANGSGLFTTNGSNAYVLSSWSSSLAHYTLTCY